MTLSAVTDVRIRGAAHQHRDSRGCVTFVGLNPRSFDGRGNFAMGIQEQIVFPEIDYDKIDKIRGLDIAITTSARTNEEGLALLRAFNFPFRN